MADAQLLAVLVSHTWVTLYMHAYVHSNIQTPLTGTGLYAFVAQHAPELLFMTAVSLAGSSP